MKANYLVCYDVCDPRRWYRVFKTLKKTGVHLQYSVFWCKLSWPELTALKEELARWIKDDEDDVRIYPMPATRGLVAVFGRGDRMPEGVEIFFRPDG